MDSKTLEIEKILKIGTQNHIKKKWKFKIIKKQKKCLIKTIEGSEQFKKCKTKHIKRKRNAKQNKKQN